MALGYFSNIEFVTNLEMPFRFVREMCQFARLAVEEMQKAKETILDVDPSQSTPLSRDNMIDMLASERLEIFPLHVRFLMIEHFSFSLPKTSINLVYLSLGLLVFILPFFFAEKCFGIQSSNIDSIGRRVPQMATRRQYRILGHSTPVHGLNRLRSMISK